MITFHGVSKIYSDKTAALDNVSFKILPREFVSLVGRSGAGKSTIIKLLIGEDKPTKGRVTFSDLDVSKLRSRELSQLRRRIGIIFQDFRLLPSKTTHENVAFALEVAGRPQREIDDLVPQALDMVGLAQHGKNFPHELSGGEKQRVAIARAMVCRPEVVVADEPTGNLDPENSEEIIKLLLKINELGTIVILATHENEIVDGLGKRVISVDKGQIIKDHAKGKYSI
ncbi:MAG: cell division ATP-binding protein FtsE [Candidatus Harrisonbacteria bacterium RIFCSPLOWO2_01_FULL_40_28]|uniref:Cell division ATP-binding protein FtsE n=1 Tax=Candidatus Harrisonbacteria bacterium RIFCSPLOWO2_01_FULL_40_28 TaxID=1798406 RepID=A0A1G1ZK63_9BACT|nr:MAG: cell division ATP-binding protein FtsE [Candidatus Harrisonbacteria bacterium RIFCSPLOWO2_01_FULL_40_28]